MTNLFERSVQIIFLNQAASPNFPNYRYCWFRDGSYIAYAMDLVGEKESAGRFHNRAAETILRHENKIVRCIENALRGPAPSEADRLHSRFTLEGLEDGREWPNHQLDGFGTWLWALAHHLQAGASSLPERWRKAVALIVEYLTAT